jgi:hypothetical protein
MSGKKSAHKIWSGRERASDGIVNIEAGFDQQSKKQVKIRNKIPENRKSWFN